MYKNQFEENYDYDLLNGLEQDLSGFLIPESASAAGFGSPASAAGSSSLKTSLKMTEACHHDTKRNSCRECFNEQNALRISQGLEPVAWGIFCKHGINKYTSKCPYPECKITRPYIYKSPPPTYAMHTEQSHQPQEQGFNPESARMFEPPIPSSAQLSDEIKPVNRNLFSQMEKKGGRKSYRKSAKKLKRKYRKSSRKTKPSSRK